MSQFSRWTRISPRKIPATQQKNCWARFRVCWCLRFSAFGSGGTHSLPDANALARCQIQFFSRLHIECSVPGIDVAHGARPVFPGRMRIRHHLLTKRRFACLLSPILSKSQEELLVT